MDRLIRKIAESSPDDPLKFVLSTDDPDLVGDVVVQRGGISLSRDPLPAQIDHGGSIHDMIGTWKNMDIGAHRTTATLDLLPKGVSQTVDLIHALKAAGIRLAASIGFVPEDWEAIWDKKGEFITGFKFLKAVLTEASIVVTPANPAALQMSKALKFPVQPRQPVTTTGEWHRYAKATASARKILA